jgi:hypothetical protein
MQGSSFATPHPEPHFAEGKVLPLRHRIQTHPEVQQQFVL